MNLEPVLLEELPKPFDATRGLDEVRELAPLRDLVRAAIPARRLEPDPSRHARMRDADARPGR